MDEPYHFCNMCSFITHQPNALTSHIIRMHKDSPQFNVDCRSCLQSYTKWDSFRNHIQHGCSEIIPAVDASVPAFISVSLSNEKVIASDDGVEGNSNLPKKLARGHLYSQHKRKVCYFTSCYRSCHRCY